MPRVTPLQVVTFSSEDPNHPVSNLLLGDAYRKWKCLTEGEPEVSATLQLDKAVTISSVNIGNENSAFVQVEVARTGSQPNYEILLSATAFMTPLESRSESNPHRVKMFGADKLSKTVAAQKWDLVRITCTQQFNKHVKYGLSFIDIHTAQSSTTVEPPKIGGFSILAPTSDDADAIKVGSFFSNKKKRLDDTSTPSSSPSTAATIRMASAALLASSPKVAPTATAMQPTLQTSTAPQGSSAPSIQVPVAQAQGSSSPKQSTSNGTVKSVPSTSRVMKTAVKRPAPSSTSQKSNVTTAVVPSSSRPKPQVRRPFEKLLDDVVFTISGYENPYRSMMRKKAIEMGATCKPDWDSSCTHLICAFVNTPKFRQVRSAKRGIIVSMKWFEDCHDKRKRLPWRKYWVDRNDNFDDGEEEILAESETEDAGLESDENYDSDETVEMNNPKEGEEDEEDDL